MSHRILLVAAILITLFPGCRSGRTPEPRVSSKATTAGEYHLIGEADVFTLVNLHPDEGRRRLYSLNYLQNGLIPLCTKIKILSYSSRQMTFRLVDSGREYTYLLHSATREPFEKNLDRFFGRSCDKAKVESMNKEDRDGITAGRAARGMTKQGVALAIGDPPEHATPNLEANAWRYWKSRFDTLIVHFEDGKVIRIQN
jgi:hypothetical protein